MRIAVITSHIGSAGLKPSGQHGGGELHTFAFLSILKDKYDVLAVTPNGFYPAFDHAGDYGIDLGGLQWKPIGQDMAWLRQFDIVMAMDHSRLYPPIANRNILSVFFPQYPHWDVSGYDTILANSKYTASWVKHYWGKDADVVYPPLALDNFVALAGDYRKKKRIVNVGRFFDVPGGNNKNHIALVEAFKRLMLPDWELVLIGAQQNPLYVNRVIEAIGNDRRISIKSNLSRQEYARELAEATFIWAATGYQAPEDRDTPLSPSSREHWGIFPVEGASVYTLPIVHNSGGTPEGPVLVWEELDDLVNITKSFIENPARLDAERAACYSRAWDFTMEAQGARLIEAIEKSVVVSPHEQKAKIFVSAPSRENITVGMISDGPEITTGFANLTRMIARGLSGLGYNIKILAYQDPHLGPSVPDDEFKTWRAWPGVSPLELLERFVSDEGINIAYLNYDPGNIRVMVEALSSIRSGMPIVSYFPIESAPVIPQIIETLRMIQLLNGEAIIYTKWGTDRIIEAGGPRLQYVHHGIDHAPFRPPEPGVAQALREAVGWQEKFVVLGIGRNKRTKNLITLIDAAKILRDGGHDDIRFYMHTNPSENIPNSSLPLDEASAIRKLDGYVYFPVDLQAQIYGAPYDDQRHIHVPETNDPITLQRYTLSAMTFIERLWLAAGDGGVLANASQAEGFGLVPLEAMACGVPVLSVNDHGVQREVLGNAPVYIEPTHSEYWNTCGLLPQINPLDMAEMILALKDNRVPGRDLSDIIGAGIDQSQKYKWQAVVEAMDKAILRRISL